MLTLIVYLFLFVFGIIVFFGLCLESKSKTKYEPWYYGFLPDRPR